MLHLQTDGLLQIVRPTVTALSGQSVHQVDADVSESCLLAATHCLHCLACRVPSVQQPQRFVVECLDADADPVERQTAEHGDIVGRKVVGVCLQCDFSIRTEPVVVANGLEDPMEMPFLQL